MTDARQAVVLIVDDDHRNKTTVRTILVDVLGFTDTNIRIAGNGWEALEVLESEEVDLVISDWNMPIMDGEALVRAMQANLRLKSTPIIIISASNRAATLALALGAKAFIPKPTSFLQLKTAVEQIFSRS